MRFMVAAFLLFGSAPALSASEQPKHVADERIPSTYIVLPSFTIPVIDDYRILGVLRVRFALRIDDAEQRRVAGESEPRLVDAYGKILAEFARVRVDPARPVNVDRLVNWLEFETKRQMKGVAAKVVVLEAQVKRS